MDKFLGLAEDAEMSEQLERRMSDFVVNDTFDAGAERMRFHYGLELSTNAFRLVAQRMGTKLERSNEIVLQSGLLPPPKEDTPLLYVLNDGSMVSTRDGWKEVKTAVMFRDNERVASQEKIRGFIECARYVSVLGGQEQFKLSVRNALRSENAGCAKKVAWIADGAAGNWKLASMVCHKAIQILDWYHAIEHASDTAKILFGEGDACAVISRNAFANFSGMTVSTPSSKNSKRAPSFALAMSSGRQSATFAGTTRTTRTGCFTERFANKVC
jgi:hypothetical protein